METTILIICGIVTLFWLVITLKVVLSQRRIRWLSPSSTDLQKTERISVIIPARNEDRDLAASLRSVLDQQIAELEVIVVNDHSTDRTGDIAEEVAGSDSRMRVIHNPPLSPGWLGKCNAMQYGAAEATGEYLLFADADIIHQPNCFATVLREMQQNHYDFISLFPLFDNQSFWENVNVPIYFFGVAKLLATSDLEDPQSPEAAASGALMLMKREILRRVGGFEGVKDQMLDDMGFARLLKRQGYRVGYRLAPECLQVRLFKNANDAFWGTTKNILAAVEGHLGLAVPLIILAALQNWAPLLAIALGAVRLDGVLLWAGIAAYGLQYLSFFSVRRLLRFRPLQLLFFPLAALVATCCILRALFHHTKGSIFWRGRKIMVGASRT
jgi:glycosyltransferase involved in cell wall biosynthesis